MAEFKRGVGEPNLNIPGVTASRGSNSRASTAKAIVDVGKIALQAGGTALARSSGEEIAGSDENAVSVNKTVNQLESALSSQDVGFTGPLSKAQIEDFRSERFNDVLTNQKRIKSALDRGLMSSTEANARLNTLRNEALSNPLISMFQSELDDAFFTSTGGRAGTGSTFFGPTPAEQDAAARRKGVLEATEKHEEALTEVQLQFKTNRQGAQIIVERQSQRVEKISRLELSQKTLNYNSQQSAALQREYITQSSTTGFGIVSKWLESGANAKDKQNAQLSLRASLDNTLRKLRKARFGQDGVTPVILKKDADKLEADAVKGFEDLMGMLDEQSNTKRITDVLAEGQAALNLRGLAVDVEIFNAAPVYARLGTSAPELSKVLIDRSLGLNDDELLNTFTANTNSSIGRLLALNIRLKTSVHKSMAEKITNGTPLDSDESGAYALMTISKGGSNAIIDSVKRSPEDTVSKLQDAPIALRDITDSRQWMSNLKTPEGVKAVSAIIEGAAARAQTFQFSNARKDNIVKGRGRGGRPTTRTVSVQAGVPSKIEISPRTSGRVRQTTGIEINTFGVPVTDQYKSSILNTHKLGTAQPTLWNAEFDTIDDWITSLYTLGGEAPPKGLTEDEETTPKEATSSTTKRRRWNIATGAFE
ncbi:MAG: hypothetical protein JKY81_02330 [Colwellia sp.]|nr:hypothetical protein [Colwellia sp.]